LLRKLRRGCQRGLLGGAVGCLLSGQLGGMFPGALFLSPQILISLFLSPLIQNSLLLGSLFGTLRGLLLGQFSGCLRFQPFGLFRFQPCCPFGGLLRGAFRLAGGSFSSQPSLSLARLLLFTGLNLASLDGCQILLFYCTLLVTGLSLFPFMPVLFFQSLLGAQPGLLPCLRPRRRKVPVFCSVQIGPGIEGGHVIRSRVLVALRVEFRHLALIDAFDARIASVRLLPRPLTRPR
jgi:hypothetical protein